jgi:hypothetical protein
MIKGDERPTKVSREEEITEPEAQAILLFKSAPLTSPLIIFRELQVRRYLREFALMLTATVQSSARSQLRAGLYAAHQGAGPS